MHPRGDVLFDYGDTLDCSSEDSDSEDTLSGAASEPSPVVSARNQTPSLDVAPSAKTRSNSSTSSTLSTTPTSGSKPPSLEEFAYAAQLEKHMSTSPLQALAIGFQTVRDLVLGPRTGSPQLSTPAKMHTPSLGESFFMVADATTDASERERRLQEELSRVQTEFQKLQLMLETMMQDQQQSASRLQASRSSQHPARSSSRKLTHTSGEKSSMPTVAIAREALLKQNLRENYLTGSEAHLSKTELESEIKNLREQLTAAERRNSEWATKWDRVKQKALGRSAGRPSSSMAAPPRVNPSNDPSDPAYRLQVSTPNTGRSGP